MRQLHSLRLLIRGKEEDMKDDKKYEALEIEIIGFEIDDVITGSEEPMDTDTETPVVWG